MATFLAAFAALPASASAAPDLRLNDANLHGAALDDGILAPGETFNIQPELVVGATDFDGGNGTISVPEGSKVSTPTYLQSYPGGSQNNAVFPANPFVLKLASDYVCGTPVPAKLSIDGGNGHGEYPISIPTGVGGPHQRYISDDIGDTVLDAETVESDVQVTADGRVKSVRVHLDKISHTYALRWYELTLVSPKDTRVTLFRRFGEDSQKYFENITFDDKAAIDYRDPSIVQYHGDPDGTPLAVQPDEPLSAFDGEPATGKWRLEVRDVHDNNTSRSSRTGAAGRRGSGEVVGQVDGWSLDVANATCGRDPIPAVNPTPLVIDPAGGTDVDASESVDPGMNNAGDAPGAITNYQWDFDGTGGFEVNAGASKITRYAGGVKGKRNIRLQVTDNDGIIREKSFEALFTKAPVISAVGSTPASPDSGQLATVSATANDPDGTIASYAWDFDGDGVFEVSGATPSTTHTWTLSGPQVVRLKVTDDTGASKVQAFIVSIANKAPIAKLSVTPTPVIVGAVATLDASESSDPDGEITVYDWDVDGVPGFEMSTKDVPTLPYTFNETGPQKVIVRVTDNSGAVATKDLVVLVTAAPTAVITASTTSPTLAQVVTFDGRASTDPDPSGRIVKYDWDLDGNNSYETSGDVVTKAYPNALKVQVKLRVTNVGGAKGEAFVDVFPKAAGTTNPPNPTNPTNPPKTTTPPVPQNPTVVVTPGLNVETIPVNPEQAFPKVADVFKPSSDGTIAEPPAEGKLANGFSAKISVASKQKVKKALKGGIAVKVTANGPGTIVVKGMVAAKMAKSLGLKPKKNAPLAVASGKLVIKKAGTFKFIVKVPKKYQRYVKKGKKTPVSLLAAVTDSEDEVLAISKKITLVK